MRDFDNITAWGCKRCGRLIASAEALVRLPQQAEPHIETESTFGTVRLITVLPGEELSVSGTALTALSPVSGYAWEVVSCAACGAELGFRFTAVDSDTEPEVVCALREPELLPLRSH